METRTGVFVDNYSIMTPSIKFTNPINNFYPYQYNYLYVRTLGRYYYIDDWILSDSGFYIAVCSEDVLASFWYNITRSKAFIQRSSYTTSNNPDIADTFYPQTKDFYVNRSSETLSWSASNTNRWTGFATGFGDCLYVLGVVSNSDASTVGSMNYYIVTNAQLKIMVQNLLANFNGTQPTNWTTEELSSSMIKSLVSPLQYIKSCVALPLNYDINKGFGDATQIKAGIWNTGAVGYQIYAGTTEYERSRNAIKYRSFDLLIPGFPDGSTNEYYSYPPYAEYTLFNEIFGVIPLDGMACSKMLDGNLDLHGTLEVNLISGDLILCLYYQAGQTAPLYLLSRHVAHPAVNIPIADAIYDYVGIAKSGVRAAGAALDFAAWIRQPTANAVTLAENTIDAIAGSLSPSVSSTGSLEGSFSEKSGMFIVQSKFFKTIPRIPLRFGYPVKKKGWIYANIASIDTTTSAARSTFLQAVDVELNTHAAGSTLGMLAAERDMIIRQLAEGVFFEGATANDHVGESTDDDEDVTP